MLTSLWRFKGYVEFSNHARCTGRSTAASSARKVRVDIPNTRSDYTSFHLWFDMVMELYAEEFGETIVPIRSDIAENTTIDTARD